jgi:alpha-tubulin suppressor-like RCC1 family protein
LRDVHFGTTHAAAIDEHGQLIQWGTGFDSQNPSPCSTLIGKNLVQVQCSHDCVFVLSSHGIVYCLDASKKKQEDISEKIPSSFWSLWFSSPVNNARYQLSLPGDAIKKISCGKDHLVALSSKGNVFSLEIQPSSQHDQLNPVSVPTLGIPVDDISSGDFHTLIKTRDGRVFGFGANLYGELGPGNSGSPMSMIKDPVEIQTLWSRHYKSSRPDNMKCTMIQAGGKTSFFVVEKQGQEQNVLSCGFGQNGQLGTGMVKLII